MARPAIHVVGIALWFLLGAAAFLIAELGW